MTESKYYLKEVKAPDGYQVDENVYEIGLEISITGSIIFRRSNQVKDICLMKQSMRLIIPKSQIHTRTFLLAAMW